MFPKPLIRLAEESDPNVASPWMIQPSRKSQGAFMSFLARTTTMLLPLVMAATTAAWAQQPSARESVASEGGPIPVITGMMSYQSNFSPGTTNVNPEFDPILLFPIGDKFLIESEFSMSMDLDRDHGKWGPAVVDHAIEYLQANYIAHPNLTVTVGRFLTPFGIFRERLHPLWIRNLQAEPILFTLNDTSGNGLMLRGAAHVTTNVDVTYATYYSVASTPNLIESDRQAGFRTSAVLPDRRIEVGISFNRTMSHNRRRMLGADFTWNLRRLPLDLRAEALTSREVGKSYWIEGAYRLNRLGRNPLLRNTQLVFRQEQYWLPHDPAAALNVIDGIGDLPDINTKRSTVGLNYYLNHGVRLNAGYGGNFALGEHTHTWNVGLTYRFAAL